MADINESDQVPESRDERSAAQGSVETAASLVHPHQLEVQEFSSYALIIDARSPHEYDEDHIPHAVNLPVVDDAEYAEVGTTHKTDQHAAYLIGVEYSLRTSSH